MAYIPGISINDYSKCIKEYYFRRERCIEYLKKANPYRIISKDEIDNLMNDRFIIL